MQVLLGSQRHDFSNSGEKRSNDSSLENLGKTPLTSVSPASAIVTLIFVISDLFKFEIKRIGTSTFVFNLFQFFKIFLFPFRIIFKI